MNAEAALDLTDQVLDIPAPVINSTDATRGQPIADRVLTRKMELEDALADLGPDDLVLRTSIETALATVNQLMTGNLAHPSDVIARDLNRWLENNKYLAV